MTLMAVHLVSHINSSQRGLGLVGRCRRAAKSFVVLWLSSAWLKRNGMQIKATRVCQILCLRSLFCLFLYINRQLPSPYNISQKCWNALSHSFKTDFLPFLPVPKVLIWYCSNFMPCDLLDFFFLVCVFIYFMVCVLISLYLAVRTLLGELNSASMSVWAQQPRLFYAHLASFFRFKFIQK